MTDKIPFIEDLSVHEVYAETAQTLFGPPGILRFELGVNRWTQQAPIHVDRVVPVARFAMSIESARMLRGQIDYCLNLVEKQAGLVQTPAASPTKN